MLLQSKLGMISKNLSKPKAYYQTKCVKSYWHVKFNVTPLFCQCTGFTLISLNNNQDHLFINIYYNTEEQLANKNDRSMQADSIHFDITYLNGKLGYAYMSYCTMFLFLILNSPIFVPLLSVCANIYCLFLSVSYTLLNDKGLSWIWFGCCVTLYIGPVYCKCFTIFVLLMLKIYYFINVIVFLLALIATGLLNNIGLCWLWFGCYASLYIGLAYLKCFRILVLLLLKLFYFTTVILFLLVLLVTSILNGKGLYRLWFVCCGSLCIGLVYLKCFTVFVLLLLKLFYFTIVIILGLLVLLVYIVVNDKGLRRLWFGCCASLYTSIGLVLRYPILFTSVETFVFCYCCCFSSYY